MFNPHTARNVSGQSKNTTITAMNATISSPAVSMILSVNPVAKTLGAMHPELHATLLRGGRAIAHNTRRAAVLLSAVFAVNASRRSSTLLLATRLLFGTLFIIMGLCSLDLLPVQTAFHLPRWAAIMEIASGGALMLGLFSRLAMLTLFGVYAWVSYEALITGFFPQTALLCTLGALLNCIAGPGRYSLDMSLYRTLCNALGSAHRPVASMSSEAFSKAC